MQTIYRDKCRTVCDVCGKIIPVKQEGRVVRDAVAKITQDVCSPKCAEIYFQRRYQLPLEFHPSSNTGVVLVKEAPI